MNHKKSIIAVVLLIVAMLLVYTIFNKSVPEPENKKTAEITKELFFKSFAKGKNTDKYIYIYEDEVDGWVRNIKLVKNGAILFASDEDIFSKNEVYFLGNDTILCVKIQDNKSCGSVRNETIVQPYLATIKNFFFNDKVTEDEIAIYKLLVEKGALDFNDSIIEKTIDDKKCSQIWFVYNYSALSLDDATKIGITNTQNMPIIYGSYCVDETGERYEKTFKMIYSSQLHTVEKNFRFKLIDAKWNVSEVIIPPQELDNNSTIELFTQKYLIQNELMYCFSKPANEKDRCIHDTAVRLNYSELCKTAGVRKGLCYFDIALAQKNNEMCKLATGLEDDCYLEMGWKTKDKSYCGLIANVTKKDFCIGKIEES